MRSLWLTLALLAAAPMEALVGAPFGAPVAAAQDHRAIAIAATERHILPRYERLAAAAGALPSAAAACDADQLRLGYGRAYDAWMGAEHIAFGPVERQQRRFAIAFWPDSRGSVKKALDRLIAAEDPAIDDPAAFAKQSVAARGLTALERLLYDAAGPLDLAPSGYRCRLAQAIARDLAAISADVLAGWRGPEGAAGALGYPEPADATRALFASLDGGVQALADLRLGRPLGGADKPRPKRAEAWRSERSLRNIRGALAALRQFYGAVFASALGGDQHAAIDGAFAEAIALAEAAPAPLHAAVTDPPARAKIERLRAQIDHIQGLLRRDLAPALGVGLAFNALDGD